MCVNKHTHALLTLDVDELLLGQGLPVDGVCSILSDVLLYQPALEDLVRDGRQAGPLRDLVGDWRREGRPSVQQCNHTISS